MSSSFLLESVFSCRSLPNFISTAQALHHFFCFFSNYRQPMRMYSIVVTCLEHPETLLLETPDHSDIFRCSLWTIKKNKLYKQRINPKNGNFFASFEEYLKYFLLPEIKKNNRSRVHKGKPLPCGMATLRQYSQAGQVDEFCAKYGFLIPSVKMASTTKKCGTSWIRNDMRR